ncbi:CocE/NonD family hydrolase [Nakamurella endophytica]|uniref:X-Pro dipeptidyl-peptidase n=1 Tax=Nakamurella endophytica TaxID=1748367 RepID=A0A917WCQ2_9ACTN|nr:CocE/NonD family hydrolase [Nakamurella endophytica]GGL92127.1 X-Pro dipeptidyl-peptidase [Nakamurella endophytica]
MHSRQHRTRVAGTEPGQRHLNRLQTTGREYRGLSRPEWSVQRTDDVPVPLRDGTRLRADVYRPDGDGRFPALLSFSCYPRQIQDLGAPLGFIESGATDFFVPRGYAQVIANARGTSGSEGTWSLLDEQERQDLFDTVEWIAAQPWCDGRVGMLGISYFAMAQLAAAVERPPHLAAVFPVATTHDLYEAVRHHGLLNAHFISAWLPAVGVLAHRPGEFWQTHRVDLVRHVLNTAPVHRRMAHVNGEAAVAVLRRLIHAQAPAEPFGRLWQEATVEHRVRDGFWDERDLTERLRDIDIPVYLGCDLENVPLHLPSTFKVWKALRDNAHVRMSLLPPGGLSWPWESLHVEALAWYDQWLKGVDTGILDGPPIRYQVVGTDQWRTADTWPPADSELRPLALRADGTLATDEGDPGVRELLHLPSDELSARPATLGPSPLPDRLSWQTPTLIEPLDVVGDVELRLDATTSGGDLAFIAVLQDVGPDGAMVPVTAGWLSAELREVDEAGSVDGAPELPCRRALPVPAGEPVSYRIPIVPTAYRVAAGHRLRLVLTHDDRGEDGPTILGFTHAPVGGASHTVVRSSSRLLLPVLHRG